MLNIVISGTRQNGIKSFVAHLVNGLTDMHCHFQLVKPHSRTIENRTFNYSDPIAYHNMSSKDILKLSGPILVVEPHPFAEDCDLLNKLVDAGAKTVLHGSDMLVGKNIRLCDKPIVVRRSLTKLVPNSTYIPHPYHALGPNHETNKIGAIALSRLTSIKNSVMIFKAAAMGAPIEVYGEPMPFYSMTLNRKVPTWKKYWKGRFKSGEGHNLAVDKKYLVDMSEYKDDNDGTQYTLLEGIDAGCCPIVHKSWIGRTWIDGINCLTASNEHDLFNLMINKMTTQQPISEIREKMMLDHNAKKIARRFIKELNI